MVIFWDQKWWNKMVLGSSEYVKLVKMGKISVLEHTQAVLEELHANNSKFNHLNLQANNFTNSVMHIKETLWFLLNFLKTLKGASFLCLRSIPLA